MAMISRTKMQYLVLALVVVLSTSLLAGVFYFAFSNTFSSDKDTSIAASEEDSELVISEYFISIDKRDGLSHEMNEDKVALLLEENKILEFAKIVLEEQTLPELLSDQELEVKYIDNRAGYKYVRDGAYYYHFPLVDQTFLKIEYSEQNLVAAESLLNGLHFRPEGVSN